MFKVSLSVVINAFKPGAFNVRQRIGAGGSAQTVKGTGTLTPMVNFAYGGAFMIPLQKGVFFSCIFPLRELTGIIIHLTDRYFGFHCGFYLDYDYYPLYF
jgi:hypothetical protein